MALLLKHTHTPPPTGSDRQGWIMTQWAMVHSQVKASLAFRGRQTPDRN